LRHQTDGKGRDIGKWVKASRNIQQCFPALRKWDFSHGNWTEWEQRRNQQQSWLEIRQLFTLDLVNGKRSSIFNSPGRQIQPEPVERKQVDESLQLFQQLLLQSSEQRPTVEVESSSNASANAISLPYLYSRSMDNWMFIDEYYDEFRELLQFDRRCCKQVPDPDESVFVSNVSGKSVRVRDPYPSGRRSKHPVATLLKLCCCSFSISQ
jgi:hypothetical protein